MNLSTVDANLFVVLNAVLETRSATLAAKRLHVTQSAVSNALARLRATFGDPLVVKRGRGLVPTPRAEELAPIVAKALAQLEGVLDPGHVFDAATTTRTFTLALGDNHQTSEGPSIAIAFRKHLPRAHLRLVSVDYLAATDGLAGGDVDAALTPEMAVLPGHFRAFAFEETATLLVRRDHPRLRRGALDAKSFAELPQIDVEVVLGKPGVGHRAWKEAGLERRVAITVPYFTTAAMLASATDCVAGVPSRVADVLCRHFPVKVARTTFRLPSMRLVLTWHERTDADPAAKHMRGVLLDALRGTKRASARHAK